MPLATKPGWEVKQDAQNFQRDVRRPSQLVPPHSTAGLWKFIPFLLVGVFGSIGGAWLILDRGIGLGTLTVGLIATPFLLWGAFRGFKEVFKIIGAFGPKLRWWHWIWLLSLSSSFVFRYRSTAEISQNPFDSSAFLRLGPEVICAAILLMRLVFRKPDWGPTMFRGVVGCVAIFGLICLTSSLWSVKFTWTLYKSLEYLLDLSIIAAILALVKSTEEYKTFIDWTWIIAGATISWAWLGLPIWPAETFGDGRLAGAYPIVSSNELGDTGAVLVLIAAIRYWPLVGKCTNKAFYVLTAILGAITMIAAQTRSAFVGLVFAGLVVLFFMKRLKVAFTGFLLAGPFAVFAVIGDVVARRIPYPYRDSAPVMLLTSVGEKILSYFQRDQSQAELMSMSSRLDWWSIGYRMFMQHPFTGLGAYAGSRFAVLTTVGAPQLHSDWLEVIVGTSIWGLAPFLIAVMWIWTILITSYRGHRLAPADKQITIEMIGVMAIITIHSFVNVEMSWHHPTLFLMILGWAELMRRQLKMRTQAPTHLRAYEEPVPTYR